jgi:hypothetical protein
MLAQQAWVLKHLRKLVDVVHGESLEVENLVDRLEVRSV